MRASCGTVAGLLPLLSLAAVACDGGHAVTVYTSVDEAYSRPLLERFEEATGVRVRAVYDVEAQKTTGLFRRLLAEKRRPRADVFWNSEVARTVQLAAAEALAPYRAAPGTIDDGMRGRDDLWTACGLRARVLVYHRERLGARKAPRSIADLAAARFRGDAAIARPLFGTSATHAGALHEALGAEGMKAFYRSLVDNDVRVVEGNAVVRTLVARGEVAVGLTDTDDAHESLLRGEPIEIVYPDQEAVFPGLERPLGTFVIPATVALVAGGPQPAVGKRLIDFLVGPEAAVALSAGPAAFLPVLDGVAARETLRLPARLVRMEVNYEAVALGVDASREFLRELFLR